MVRRGSTVRVRQRASRNALQNGYLSCLCGKRLSRAGTRGHSLVFPRQAYRQVVFGLIKLIRTDLTRSVPRRDLAESPGTTEMSAKGYARGSHVQHGGDPVGANGEAVELLASVARAVVALAVPHVADQPAGGRG